MISIDPSNILTILVLLPVIVYLYFKWSFNFWKKHNFPYLEPKFPFGNMENPLKRTQHVSKKFTDIYKEAKSRGLKHIGVYSLSNPIYVPTNLDYVRNIMTKDFEYFMGRGIYHNEKSDPLSAHLFSLSGHKWRNLRTKLTPTFTSGKMKMMFQTLLKVSESLDEYIDQAQVNNQDMEIKDVLSKFTIDVIGSCAFGLECNSFSEPNSPFVYYGRRIFPQSSLRSLKMNLIAAFPTAAKILGVRFFNKEVTDFYLDIVKKTVGYRMENNVKRNDFLQILMEIKDTHNLTIEEAAAQCFVFFIAGFEASSTTMSFALFEIARNATVQDKLRKEIQDTLKKHNGEFTYEGVHEMKYLEQVIDETLRKYPAVPILRRICDKDYKIPDENLVIPKGTSVIIPVTAIHNDPDYYDNPDKFDPDHFSSEKVAARHNYAHLPFGEGPRNCIGMRFGSMQTRIGLAVLLNKYRFLLSKRTKLPLQLQKFGLIPVVDGGIWLYAEKL